MNSREHQAVVKCRQVRVSRKLPLGKAFLPMLGSIAQPGTGNPAWFAQGALKNLMIHGVASVQ
jgi:hypothetical protein